MFQSLLPITDGMIRAGDARPGPTAVKTHTDYRLRKATDADAAAIGALIARSIRQLGAADYTPAQIEGALQGAFGVDTSLIRDQTYFVVTAGSCLPAGAGASAAHSLARTRASSATTPCSIHNSTRRGSGHFSWIRPMRGEVLGD